MIPSVIEVNLKIPSKDKKKTSMAIPVVEFNVREYKIQDFCLKIEVFLTILLHTIFPRIFSTETIFFELDNCRKLK